MRKLDQPPLCGEVLVDVGELARAVAQSISIST
jgi:hypothetical protein